ncbi:methenyltetrahydrofolate cyclohydrolase /5,10-methylenetetrahydrofolate dehydrogenase (NADP+) [Ligilactobacillus sp. WC1T17]|uniref:Bifunctional protein FolD n=1 Tax=Ligilactobacillus ruminis TaxID=1623 RepID=A0ABY1A9J7_9LACO|nr:methenyltetrahydrofolate cyclohydrolase /5,10-methylenetetrahydrofolate dehydrogenase (NADP+) [Ligilactobacillus ruminis]
MTILMNGRDLAQKVRESLKERVNKLKKRGVTPTLAVILVGDDEASKVYVRNKHRAAEKIGIKTIDKKLPQNAGQEEVIKVVKSYNNDPNVHGVLVQMPLPKQIDEKAVIDAISPKKDVDGSHPENMGRLFMNEARALPCTPRGIMELLDEYDIDVRGQEVVIVGRSNLVGRPLAALMINASATVTVAHSVTHKLQEVTKKADILVVAVGQAGMIDESYIKPGAVVIDVGINRTAEGKLSGDVNEASVMGKASFLTPVPGGVGPMTVSMLMKQTVEFAERSVVDD